MNVLVTGTATPFAELLLPRLLAHPGIDLVVGIDREQSEFVHENFVQVLIDPRSAQIARVLRGLDAVIHLAAELAEADPVASVVGTQNLCALALGDDGVGSKGAHQLLQESGQTDVFVEVFLQSLR